MSETLWRRGALVAGVGLGIAAGRIGAGAAMLTSLMLYGARQPLWRTPADVGLAAEEVSFYSADGIRLAGWFIPANTPRPAPTVAFVHGWPWNRCGNRVGAVGLIPDRTVSFLEPARALQQAGFNVLLFDLRNHGASQAAAPVTFGPHEVRDLIGAVGYLHERPEVDKERIGLIGYSMGANTLLYGIPEVQPIRAAIAVQPVRGGTFGRAFARDLLGPLGPTLYQLADPLQRALGGPGLDAVDPSQHALQLGTTRVLYVQGDCDPWSDLREVEQMVALTPNAAPLVTVPARDRYAGYGWVERNEQAVVAFFQEHLA